MPLKPGAGRQTVIKTADRQPILESDQNHQAKLTVLSAVPGVADQVTDQPLWSYSLPNIGRNPASKGPATPMLATQRSSRQYELVGVPAEHLRSFSTDGCRK